MFCVLDSNNFSVVIFDGTSTVHICTNMLSTEVLYVRLFRCLEYQNILRCKCYKFSSLVKIITVSLFYNFSRFYLVVSCTLSFVGIMFLSFPSFPVFGEKLLRKPCQYSVGEAKSLLAEDKIF
jgi:hypothetical protein